MTNPRRAALPFVLAAAALVAAATSGVQAQAPPSPRFAFADTTLLRDTLGLRFDRLFETADSLGLLPDSLRAHIIRYRLPMQRLVFMADSMNVPVDSVGHVIARERFNPFLRGVSSAPSTQFKYTSDYNIARNQTTWTNGADFTHTRGRLLIRNGTSITMERTTISNRLSLRQNRESFTEASWRMSPNLSLGSRAFITGYDNLDPGSTANEGETRQDYQVSARTRQQYTKELTSELNLFTGYLDLKNFGLVKRGLSGDVNGRTKFVRGTWLSHELNGGVNGNLARTRRPVSTVSLGTRDLSGTVRGVLQLYQQSLVGLTANYSARRSQVETPTDADTVNRLVTSGANADATVRVRQGNDRFLNLTGKASRNRTLQGTRTDREGSAQGRWVQGAWELDGQISNRIGDSRYPRQIGRYGYNEREDRRAARAELKRAFGRKLIATLTTDISLSQFRSQATADSAVPPTPRDSYRQSYRAQASYNASEKFTSAVALDVGLSRAINLPSTSTSNNNDTRTYRAEWRWNYRLFRGLTANQSNTVQANYQFYPFAPDRNQLSLDYYTITQLNAVLTPRLTVEINHNARQQPSGDWRVLEDGSGALLPADENLNYTLRSRVTYSPVQAFSLSLAPEYVASDRNGTVNGVESPTRRSRRLNLSGFANLNLNIGRRGQLSGNVGRTFYTERATTYRNGVPQATPLSEQDYWNGFLQFSWEL